MADNTRSKTTETNSIKELKDYFEKRFNDLEESFSSKLLSIVKVEIQAVVEKQEKKIEELESTVAVLRQHVSNLKDSMQSASTKTDDLEQYGRRLCLRMDGFPSATNETADEVLIKVKSKFEEAGLQIPDEVIDRAHRIGPTYKDRVSDVEGQSVLVRLTTFRHRTMIYRKRGNMGDVRVKLDLTKERYQRYREALKIADSAKRKVEFVFVDVNCRLSVRLRNGSVKIFNTLDDLKEIIEQAQEFDL